MRLDETTLTLTSRGIRWRMTMPAGLRATIEPSAYSPSYGVKVPCLALNVSSRVQLDGDGSYRFTVSP
jgi:hypothetical protein